jgi:hypothetical protein
MPGATPGDGSVVDFAFHEYSVSLIGFAPAPRSAARCTVTFFTRFVNGNSWLNSVTLMRLLTLHGVPTVPHPAAITYGSGVSSPRACGNRSSEVIFLKP